MEKSILPLLDMGDKGTFTYGNLTLDLEKGTKLLLELYKWYVKRKGLYAEENADTAPQNTFRPDGKKKEVKQLMVFGESIVETPTFLEGGSSEDVLWRFFSTGLDRRTASNNVYRITAGMYRQMPWLFHGGAVSYGVESLAREFKRRGMHMENQSASHWVGQSATLFRDFGGDPIRLLKACGGTVEGVLAMKKFWKSTGRYPWSKVPLAKQKNLFQFGDPLPGYGPKITSLFMLFLAEIKKFKMPDDAFAVDLHVQRIFLQYGAITVNGNVDSSDMEKVLRPFICTICRIYKLNKVHLAHALWQLGSKLCKKCHVAKYVPLQCAIEKSCSGPILTDSYHRPEGQERGWSHPLIFKSKGHKRIFKLQKGNLM